jgi:hypothetical protein
MTIGPCYWMHETSGVLRPAVVAYLKQTPMTDEQVAAMRAYLRQWIMADVWVGEDVDYLRAKIDGLTSSQAIRHWLDEAAELNIDPL